MRRIALYIHEQKDWTHFFWDETSVSLQLAKTKYLQGKLMGKMESLGFDLQDEALLNTLTSEIVKSSEIEGEKLDLEQVRSSLAKRLGIAIAGTKEAERHIDGIVEMMLNATQAHQMAITKERLFAWHAALFPTGWSNLYKIKVASWRDDSTGPMQVVSGAMGKEKVHFQAPDSAHIPAEMKKFFKWVNSEPKIDPVLKAAIAHFWFVTIHPFEDGNGRITRAITELLLARSDNSMKRFYSMSSQIKLDRKEYYLQLEIAQKGNSDITSWLLWFLKCLEKALESSNEALASILFKSAFWNHHAKTIFNPRQQKILNQLFDSFTGKLSTSKWAKICKCSQDTALRDIQDLIKKDILQKEAGGGRSTNYELNKTAFLKK